MKLRAARARKHPAKAAERAVEFARYVAAATKARAREGGEALRWLVEEFRVSLFAQELGTAEPVSAKKLDRALAHIPSTVVAPPRAAPAPKAIVTAPVIEKKSGRLKDLGALDKLFPR